MTGDFLKVIFFRAGAASGFLIFSLVCSQYYSTHDVADIFMGVMLLYIFSMLSKSGMDMLLLKKMPHLRVNKARYASNALALVFVISILVSCLLSIIQFHLEWYEILYWVALTLPGFTILQVVSNLFRTIELKFISAVAEPGMAFLFVSVVLFCFAGSEIEIKEIVCFFIYSSCVVFCVVILKLGLFSADAIRIRTMLLFLRRAHPFIYVSVSSYLLMWLPVFVVENYSSQQDFVDLNVALRLISPMSFLIVTVDLFLSKYFGLERWKAEPEKTESLFARARKYLFIGMGGYLVLSVLFLLALQGFFYAINDKVVILYFLLACAYTLSSWFGPVGILLTMTGNERVVSRTTFYLFFAVLVVSIPLVSMFGTVSAAFLISLTVVVKNYIQFRHARYLMRSWFGCV